MPLGVMEGTTYEEYESPIAPGQIITIGTDGVWEAVAPSGEMFGKDRLRAAIRSAAAAGGTAADVEAAIARALAAFRGAQRPHDDETFVVIRVIRGAEELPHAATR